MRTIIKIKYSDCKPLVDTLSKAQKANAQVIDAGCCECPYCKKDGCLMGYETIELMNF